MEVAGIIISVIALIVSCIVAWKNYLSPFRLSVYSGNPRLEPCPCELTGGKHVIRFAVILPLYFVNRGAHDGVIRDIVLTVFSEQNKWAYYPVFYCKYSVSTEAILGKTLTKEPSNEPFYPLHLQGKATVYKAIVFILDARNEKYPLGENPLSPGKYTFQVKTIEARKSVYEDKLAFHITLAAEKIANFPSMTGHIPFIDEVRDKRQTL